MTFNVAANDYITNVHDQAVESYELARKHLGAAAERRKISSHIYCGRYLSTHARYGILV